MKKFLVLILMVGLSFAGKVGEIRESLSDGYVKSGDQFIQLEVIDHTQATADTIVFYGDNIAGYSSINFYGASFTTLSAQAVYANGNSISVDAQTITSGTDLTDFKSAFYKFTVPAPGATRTVSFNFLIAD